MTDPWEGEPLEALGVGGGGMEDRFTHALNELLQDQLVLRSFLESCCQVTAPAAHTTTQAGVEDGRADIRVVGPGLYLLIEVKVGAWLHGAQMSAYARHVAARRDGKLLLLAPKDQIQALMDEARNQLGADYQGILLEGAAWSSVRDLFQKLALQPDVAPRLATYLRDFAGVIDKRIETERPPFTAEEFGLLRRQDLPILTDRLEWVAERISSRLRGSFDVRPRASAGRGFFGCNLTIDGYSFWCGYYPEAWRRWGASPFWVQSLQPVTGWHALAEANGWPTQRSRDGRDTNVPLLIPEPPPDDMGNLVAELATQAARYLQALSSGLRQEGLPPGPELNPNGAPEP